MSIEQEIYDKLVEQFGIGEICIKKYRDRPSKTWLEFILAALKLETQDLHDFCGFSTRATLSKYFIREFPSLTIKKGERRWARFLINLVDRKKCCYCGNILLRIDFNKSISNTDGLNSACRDCTKQYRLTNKEKIVEYRKEYYQNNKYLYNARDAKRRAAKLQATPKWADLEAIKEVYKSCPPGYHVDHVIPLQGELVCGLHVHKNLKPIPAKENNSKSNKYTIV